MIEDRRELPGGQMASRGAQAGRGRSQNAALYLTGLLLFLVSLLVGALLWQSYAATIAAAEARARGAAHVAATHMRWLGEASFQALRRIDDALGPQPTVFTGATASDLDSAVAELPAETYAWVVDTTGHPVLSNAPSHADPAVGEMPFFAALKAGERRSISVLFQVDPDGRKAFALGHRIERQGVFLGAAIIVIPAEMMSTFWLALDLGPDSSVGLIRADGWLVARYPVPDTTVDLSGYRLFTQDLARADEGLYHAERSPLDGVARIVAFRRVEGLPLVVVAGVSKDEAVAVFWNRAGLLLVAAGPIALALLLCALWVARLLRADQRSRLSLARALAENRVLFHEVHHRVKNNLQVVMSLVQLLPGSDEAKQEMLRRISAMAALHERIYRSNRISDVELSNYLQQLCASLREIYGGQTTLTCDVPALEVSAEVALPLGLIASEAISNAFKHAFDEGQPGRIDLVVSAESPSQARLVVRDNGKGRGESGTGGTGIGLRLIESLARRIGASLSYDQGATDPPSQGTALSIVFPLLRSDASSDA